MPLTIPQYIEIRTAAGQLAAVLSPEADGLKECWIDQRLNAECTLTFLLPMTSEKWAELTAECRILAGGREFIILRPDAVDVVRDGQKLWGKVMAAESWALLNKQYPTIPVGATDLTVTILSSDPGQGGFSAGSAGSALYRILQGSAWSVGTVDVAGTHDLETEKLSLLENIQKVQEIWGGYLVWDSINKTVSLRAENLWQNYTGFQVRYAKNLKSITRTVNYDIITRLYPFGENDLDISSVNGGVKYLENFSFTPSVYVGIYQNQDIDDPTELKNKATEVLAKLAKPRYTYRVQMVDLRTLPEYSHEDFALGDMVDVIDEGLGVNVRARVMRHRYNVFQPWKCELEIGEPEERLVAKLADSFDVARFVKEALRPNPATSNLLKGFINTFATQINSANGKLVWDDATLTAIEIDVNGNPTGKRVRITPGGIGISADGGQTYSTAMTGQGVLANKIIANELYVLGIAPGGINIENGLPDSQIASAPEWNATAQNFNTRNDRITTAPAAPAVATDGTAVDHTINTDGSANVSFEWQFSGSGDAYDVDGFLVYVYASDSAAAYTFGADPSNERQHVVTADKRALILQGVPANKYYTFGVQSYRMVDQDITPAGVLKSAIVKPSASGEDPYRPAANVAFAGDISGTVAGVPAATVAGHVSQTGGGVHGLPSYVRLQGDGLHCFDDLNRERAVFGGWVQSGAVKYGVKAIAEDGSTVILDHEGILQTWQEGRADNVDASNPLVLNVYLPPETRSVHKALLRFRLQAFRAYETGAASGGGGTSGASSTTTTGPSSTTTTVTNSKSFSCDYSSYLQNFGTTTGGSHEHSSTSTNGGHVHSGETSWTIPTVSPDHYHDYRYMNSGGSHSHSVNSSGSSHSHAIPDHYHPHSHGMDHTHGMAHTHSVPDHTHSLVFGIYTSSTATGVTVKINGTDRTSVLGGPFSSDQSSLNIAPYFIFGQWNTIELGSSQLGRIDATIFIQAKMGV